MTDRSSSANGARRAISQALLVLLLALPLVAQADRWAGSAERKQQVTDLLADYDELRKIGAGQYEKMRCYYPNLKDIKAYGTMQAAIPAQNVRFGYWNQPKMQRLLDALSGDAFAGYGLVGMSVHPSGHPVLITRGPAGSDGPAGVYKYDTNIAERFHNGTTARRQKLTATHSNTRTFFLWLGPKDLVEKLGRNVDRWRLDNQHKLVEWHNWAEKREFSCSYFLTKHLHNLGNENDSGYNPFKGVWGVPTKECTPIGPNDNLGGKRKPRCGERDLSPWGHNAFEAGAMAVLDKISSSPDLILVVMPEGEYNAKLSKLRSSGEDTFEVWIRPQ